MENNYIKSLVKLEGDKKEFEYRGFRCLVKRHLHLGHLCGYVEIPENHHLYEMDYDEIEKMYDYAIEIIETYEPTDELIDDIEECIFE